MKTIQRVAFTALFAGVSAFSPAYSHAFMVDAAESASVGSVDLTQSVDQLRQELKTGETACKEMLAKIDAAIEQVDSALDIGVADEKKYLGLRDELVEMRLSLPCLSEELTQAEGDVVSDTMVDQQVIGEQVVAGEEDQSMVGGAFGGSSAGNAGGFGGSGGLGGAGGIGGLGPLALGGIAAAIAIPVALSGNDDPGSDASPVQ